MDHPTPKLWDESPAGLLAFWLSGDGASKPELSFVHSPATTILGDAENHVGMPLRDAERDAFV